MKRVWAILLIILGVLGVGLVCTYDIIAGKEVNDFIGPKSTPAMILSGILIVLGIIKLKKTKAKKDKDKEA